MEKAQVEKKVKAYYFFSNDDSLDSSRLSLLVIKTHFGVYQYIIKKAINKDVFYVPLSKKVILKLWSDKKGNLLFSFIPISPPIFLSDYEVVNFDLLNVADDISGNLLVDTSKSQIDIKGLSSLLNAIKDITGVNVPTDVLVLLAYLLSS
ncbi:hypothetical protein [Sulfolobus islandicus rod-shaped virus 3]|uniref:Uncharacterized protein n=4 Tax=root TaxID=1 RepID=A0A1B3SN31_9VIRU|nr:hypothetical protein BHS13_gp40 [Sulfolobus islandicus rudivirus 3]AOG61598.1 hypothetical protein [Sulfolobus islandicus rod-shaped virus 3]